MTTRKIGVVATALLVILAGCTSTTPEAPSVAQVPRCDRLPAILAENGPCLAQNMTLSGEISGSVLAAIVKAASPSQQCQPPTHGGIRTNVNYEIYMAGKPYTLSISSNAPYEGSANSAPIAPGGLLAGAHANLVAGANPILSLAWTGTTGTVTTDADGITGTVDATMIRGGTGAAPVHLTGQWRCASAPHG